MAPKLLFIVGMQKSGTSLLNRMLMAQNVICNPFLPEGKFFWGDNPPFTPVDKPCGKLYQYHNGKNGHYLSKSDFNKEDQQLLKDRIKEAAIMEPILMNKNPFNSVRIEWLKKVFPECKIISMVRNPIANVFSLLKKYEKDHNQIVGPENGWWGIKPKSWLHIKSEDKLKQCSLQWSYVNKDLLNSVNDIEMIINYETLCDHPNFIVGKILHLFGLEDHLIKLPKCKNLNSEYLHGSRLLSKNQEFRKSKGFDLSGINETIEMQPLSCQKVEQIHKYCSITWDTIKKECEIVPNPIH